MTTVDDGIYNLLGIKIADDASALDRLPAGIYVINIKNTGTDNLVITDLKNAPDGWSLPGAVTVAPGQSNSVALLFVPYVRNAVDGVIDITPVGRAQGFECSMSRVESGCIRVLCYGMGTVIHPGAEKILNITFNPTNLSANSTYIVDAANVVLANSELDDVYSGEVSAAISIPGNTAIENISVDNALVTVFDLQGMELMRNAPKDCLNNLPTGLYIVNGVKTYIRH